LGVGELDAGIKSIAMLARADLAQRSGCIVAPLRARDHSTDRSAQETTMAVSAKVECKHEARAFAPVIDRTKCEGKEDCVRVCPYDVFEMGVLSLEQRRSLPFGARIKAWAHRNRQAFAVNADDCHACGLCVAACPEHAIKLERAASSA
jgi:4Fe-4S ferredoxin